MVKSIFQWNGRLSLDDSKYKNKVTFSLPFYATSATYTTVLILHKKEMGGSITHLLSDTYCWSSVDGRRINRISFPLRITSLFQQCGWILFLHLKNKNSPQIPLYFIQIISFIYVVLTSVSKDVPTIGFTHSHLN